MKLKRILPIMLFLAFVMQTASAQDVRLDRKTAKQLSDKDKAARSITKALQNDNAIYRSAMLGHVKTVLGDEGYTLVASLYPQLTVDARCDVLKWLVQNNRRDQYEFVIKTIEANELPLSLAGIKAAGALGGDELLDELFMSICANDERHQASIEAILSFNGNVAMQVPFLLFSGDEQATLGAFHIMEVMDLRGDLERIEELQAHHNKDIRAAADRAMERLTTPVDDNVADNDGFFDEPLAGNKDSSEADNGTTEERPQVVYLNRNELYDFDTMDDALAERPSARRTTAHGYASLDKLFAFAYRQKSQKDTLLLQALEQLRSTDMDETERYRYYYEAIRVHKPSQPILLRYIAAMKECRFGPSFHLAATSLYDVNTAPVAAITVKEIVRNTPSLQHGSYVHDMLAKAGRVLARGSNRGNAAVDDAIKDIKQLLDNWDTTEGFGPLQLEEGRGNTNTYVFDGSDFEFYFSGCLVGTIVQVNGTTVLTRTGEGIAAGGSILRTSDPDILIYIKKKGNRLTVKAGKHTVCDTTVAMPNRERASISIRYRTVLVDTFGFAL